MISFSALHKAYQFGKRHMDLSMFFIILEVKISLWGMEHKKSLLGILDFHKCLKWEDSSADVLDKKMADLTDIVEKAPLLFIFQTGKSIPLCSEIIRRDSLMLFQRLISLSLRGLLALMSQSL